jgi:hypothetical protein
VKDKIEIDKREVYRYMGYENGHRVPASISSLINKQIAEAYELIEPEYSYVIRKIREVEGTGVYLTNSIVFDSEIIAQLLGRCNQTAVFLVTIGKGLEERTFELAEEGHILESVVLDAIGSNAVEKVADTIQSKIKEIASVRGLSISQRYSPGYCDWDISQQKMLFQAMNGASVNIRLTDGFLMVPQKSISGIIGIAPADSGLENFSPCETCPNRFNCPNRR